jgi:hypothetical protein
MQSLPGTGRRAWPVAFRNRDGRVVRPVADQPRLVHGVVEYRFVEIEHHGGGQARQLLRGSIHLFQRGGARRGVRDALGSQAIHLLGAGAVLGRGLHP